MVRHQRNYSGSLYIPDIKTAKFHLIAVAHSSSARCRQEFGGTGSLKIKTSIKGNNHYVKEAGGSPFYIGDIDPNRTFVHILDDISLDSVLSNLDTVSDFVAYLTKKEEFFRSRYHISAASELEILAQYHKFINDDGERDFFIPEHLSGQGAELILEEGYWKQFEQSPERKAKLEEDKISYKWDAIIESINHYTFRGNLYFTSHSSVAEQEILLRFLARENRFHRRILSEILYDLIYSAPSDGTVTARYVPHPSYAGFCYVFLVHPHFEYSTYEQYRKERRNALYKRCLVAKLRFPDAQYIVGVATETVVLSKEGRSTDVTHVDVTNWTSEDDIQVKQIEQELKLCQDLQTFCVHYEEYPVEEI